MPSSAPSPCRHPGCRALVEKPGFCIAHAKTYRAAAYQRQKSEQTPEEKESKRFYDRVAWKKVRSIQLQDEPLCRKCRSVGRLTEATVVDHIIERSKGGDDYAQENLQSLCKPCHDAKTRRQGEYQNFGR
jgi:5-methylcytosine-specific restriction protein A